MKPEPLIKATTGLQAIVEYANSLLVSAEGLLTLSERPGSIFCPAIKIYSQLLTSYSLNELNDLDDYLKRNADFEESAEAFWNVEEQWDEVLSKIDVALNKGVKGCVVIKKVGDIAPLDTALINVKDQDMDCQLENVLDENLGLSVHLVLLRHLS